jgi:hypothetical protein
MVQRVYARGCGLFLMFASIRSKDLNLNQLIFNFMLRCTASAERDTMRVLTLIPIS